MAHTYQNLQSAEAQRLTGAHTVRLGIAHPQGFRRLPWFCVAVGLLVMLLMFIWSFHLENDFTGQYGSKNFHHQFWLVFFTGALLYLLGCLAVGTTMKMQTGTVFGAVAALAGVVLFQVIMPRVDFHGWTGGSGYISLIALSSGGVLALSLVGLRYLWRKFRNHSAAA